MDKQIELQQWKEIADIDLIYADYNSKKTWPVPFAIASFHCQQAVEKYLKWFLVLHDIEPPKNHDLEELEKLCETIETKFSEIYEKCVVLTKYAVQTRYPQEIPVEKQDMEKALEYAKSIRNFFHKLFPAQYEELIFD